MSPRVRNALLFGMWSVALGAATFIFFFQRTPVGETPTTLPKDVPVYTPRSPRAPTTPRSGLEVHRPEPGPPSLFRLDRRHTGRSAYAGPREGVVAWKSESGGRISAQVAVAANGRIFVGSHDGMMRALDPSGRELWRRDLGERIYCAPLVDDAGNVYVGSDADFFYALAADGSVRWKLPTEGDADTGAALAPDGTLRFSAGNDLFAVKRDGTVLWRFRARAKIYTVPAIDEDGTAYVGAQDDAVYAVANDGRMRWSFSTGKDNDSSPVIGDDGTIYFGSDDKHVYALTRDGALRWKTRVGGFVRAPIALTLDGGVLAGVYGPRARLVSLDAATGEERWTFPVLQTETEDLGVASGALVDRDGGIYFGAHDDFLYAITPQGQLRWAFETGGDVDASPVLTADGTLLFGSDDRTLYALRRP